MDSRRQQKIANLLQKEFAAMLNNELKEYTLGAFVTVTYVTVTPDLSLARFNLSVMGYEPKMDVIQNFKEHKNEIRGILGRKVNNLRKIPDVAFYLDDRLDYVERMDKIIKEINPKEEEE